MSAPASRLLILAIASCAFAFANSHASADDFEDRCVLLAATAVPPQARILKTSLQPAGANPPSLKVEFTLVVGDRQVGQRFDCWNTPDGARVRPSP